MRFLTKVLVNLESKGHWNHSIPCLAPHPVFPGSGITVFLGKRQHSWRNTQSKHLLPVTSSIPYSCSYEHFFELQEPIFPRRSPPNACKPLHPPLNHDHFINPLKHLLLLTEDLKYFLPFCSKIVYFGKLWSWYVPTSTLHHVGLRWVLPLFHWWVLA